MSPDNRMSAKGNVAKPPKSRRLPIQRKGTRFHPIADLCVSDLNPISALNGANTNGKATIIATIEAGTPSSTIITRFKVPTNNTKDMPTDTCNKDN